MPSALSYPGVYIEEVPSGVRTITGVPTSIAAFIGRAARGPVDEPVTINGFGDFERIFGGLWLSSQLGFAVRDFFLNGGGQAIVVRLFGDLGSAERTNAEKAAAAAAAVAAAADGADAAAAATAAKTKAESFADEPQKSAAASVAAAAKTAADAAGATKEQVAAAANAAAAEAAKAAVPTTAALAVDGLRLAAANPGRWGANLRVEIDKNDTTDEVARALGADSKGDLFNLTVRDARPGGATERFANLTVTESARRIDRVLAAESALLRSTLPLPATVAAGTDPVSDAEAKLVVAEADLVKATVAGKTGNDLKKFTDDLDTARKKVTAEVGKVVVSDGRDLKAVDFLPTNGEVDKHGLYALDKADLFNLLCIPPYAGAEDLDVEAIVIAAATAYCERRRAIHLIDAPSDWKTKAAAKSKVGDLTRSKNAALYFPRLRQPNLLRESRIETFAPCGAVAGVIARTDTQRGVWKAPAGLDATLAGVPQLAVDLTDAENGELNPLGINCLRALPVAGRVVWGARTLRGADQLADEWKYLPVRRTALFIEESLYRGTQWVVFEPNDEPLWAQIRLNVGAFMHGLFRQGAFQGTSPRDAYFVKCDKESTTQADIDRGIVNIAVGFAPLKPAEFVVIRLQQIAGQIQT